jgi:hypothetical protein
MIVRSSGALGSVLWTVVALTLTIGCSSERHSRAKPAERGAARAEEPDAAVSGTGSDAAPDSAGQDAAPDPAGMAGEPRKADDPPGRDAGAKPVDAASPPAVEKQPDAPPPCTGSLCEAEVARRARAIVMHHATQAWPAKGSCWGDVTWAFAVLYTHGDEAAANAAFTALPSTYNLSEDPKVEDDCYWAHPQIMRVMLHPETRSHLTAAARQTLLDLMWSYLHQRSLLADATGSIWNVSGSENHDLMRKTSYLLFSQILSTGGRGKDLLADGHSVDEHHSAWTEWAKRYLQSRAREGISCEIASPTYDLYSVQGIANLRDLSDSPVVRRLADAFLTLFWADYAQDFLHATGVRGGAMTRMYKDASLTQGTRENLIATTYMYGWHEAVPTNTNPDALIMATSDYRPPAIVSSMALEPAAHAYVARHFGLGTQVTDAQGIAYTMSFPNGNASIRRQSWHTSDYVLGSVSLDLTASYTALDNQNRAMGVMFASNVNDRIIVAGNGTDDDGRRGNAEIHGVSGKDCLLVARDTHATNSSGTRIFVSKGALWDNRVQAGGWLFTHAGGAYVGVRVANGNWSETSMADGTMLDLSDMWSPIVIQTGVAGDYASFAAFQSSVMDNMFVFGAGRLSYRSEAGNTFEIWSQSANLPRVDGHPVELNPALTYDSPYLRGVHGENQVTLMYPGMMNQVLDFAY